MPYRDNGTQTLLLICFSILAAGLAVIFSTQLSNRELGRMNQAYDRVQLCIIGVSPIERKREHLVACYEKIEKEFDVKLVRYGDAR